MPSPCASGSCEPPTTVVGYMGGVGCSPTYANYTSFNNYSETLRLVYDGVKTTYSDLLAAYWQFVPDTTQECDDPAYCPRIFYVDDDQKNEAMKSMAAQNKKSGATSLLAILPAKDFTFWKAEEFHQNYFSKMGQQCSAKPWLPARTSAR